MTASAHRDENLKYLEQLLTEVKRDKSDENMTDRHAGLLCLSVRYTIKKHFSGLPKAKFMKAMQAEGIPVKNGIDSNLHKDPFIDAYLNLESFKRIYSKERLDKYRKELHCPVNEYLSEEKGIGLYQAVFLGPKKDMEDIVAAIVKVQKNASKLI